MTFLKHNWIWIIPALLLVVFSLFSITSIDSTRDFVVSFRLLHHENYPLLGPKLAQSFYIGPLWAYLMALPLLFSSSWLSLSIWVAMLNGFKFYLAYQMGLLLKDKHLGQLFVLCLLMISFTAMQTITFTHTSVVEACMLAVIYFCFKSPLNKYSHWFILGVLCALAFHAHPTAVVAGYFALNKWLKSQHKIFNLGFFMLGLIPLFLPVLIGLLIQDSNEAVGVLDYFSQQTSGFDVTAVLKLVYGLVFISPWSMLSIGLPTAVVAVLYTIQAFVQLCAILIPLLKWQHIDNKLQRLYLNFALFFILSCIGIVLIRSRTPWYMTFGLSLAYSMFIASGLYIAFRAPRFKIIRSGLSAIVWFTFLLCHTALIFKLQHNQTRLPSTALNDLRSMNHDLSILGYDILAKDAKRHGQLTCDQQPVAVHGPYAALVHTHTAIEHYSQCTAGLYYGPAEHSKHLIGVPGYYQKHIKIKPFKQISDSHFFRPKSVSANQKVWQEVFQHEYERPINYSYKNNWDKHVIETELNQGQHLLITKLLGFKMQLKVIEVAVNGTPIKPIADNNYSSLYRCEACDPQRSRWQIKYAESVEGMSNIVSF